MSKKEDLSKVNEQLTETVEAAEVKEVEAQEEIEALKSQLADAKNQITSFKHYDEALSHPAPRDYTVEFADVDPRFGDQRFKTPAQIETERLELEAKLDMLAFFEEPIEVYIDTTSEKNADQTFFISVNGEKEYFHRGQTKTVARKYVEQLIRTKPISYDQRELDQHVPGMDKFELIAKTGLKYPFSITNEPNKEHGIAWYRATLAQSA